MMARGGRQLEDVLALLGGGLALDLGLGGGEGGEGGSGAARGQSGSGQRRRQAVNGWFRLGGRRKDHSAFGQQGGLLGSACHFVPPSADPRAMNFKRREWRRGGLRTRTKRNNTQKKRGEMTCFFLLFFLVLLLFFFFKKKKQKIKKNREKKREKEKEKKREKKRQRQRMPSISREKMERENPSIKFQPTDHLRSDERREDKFWYRALLSLPSVLTIFVLLIQDN